MDPRIDEWAELLVDYSMDIEENDVLQIAYDPGARDLALAVYAKAIQAGAHHPGQPRVVDDAFQRVFYREADEDQLTHIAESERVKAEELDARLYIRASGNESELADVPAEARQTASRARQELKELLLDDTKWCLTQYPTEALAQKAEMSTEAYRDFVFDACVKDWAEESEAYRPLKELVDAGSTVHITKGDDTDLTFSIGERNGINRVGMLSDGTRNVPGGEVFTAPIKDSVNGEITFDLPAMVDGTAVEGIHLVFDDGEIIDYSAEKGEALLDEKLNTDAGARYLGEFGIGTNFDIDRFTKDILFDEKIGGSIHLAVGRAYRGNLERVVDTDAIDRNGLDAEEFEALVDEAQDALHEGSYAALIQHSSNAEKQVLKAYRERWEALADDEEEQHNQSAVHWDMIKDLRDGGTLEIDGETIMADGEFVAVDTL